MADTYFFSPEDRERIKAAAATPWGRPIVEGMRRGVEERVAHSMEIPELESGHYHHYFCPEHNRLLIFDWDSPTRHLCPECGKHIEGERYDHAWRKFIHGHNQVFLRNCTLLSIITGEREYLEHIRPMLLAYAERYPSYRLHGHNMKFDDPWYGGRMFCQTLDEAYWVVDVAPAHLEALSVMTGEEAEKATANLLRPVAETILRNQTHGNWQVWHNAGVASIAIAVGDDDLLKVALEDPDHGYNAMMEKGVTADGWWYERSPGYHFYPLHAMVRTAEAVRCRGIDLYDESLRAMFVGPLNSVYCDLAFPSHNDGWHGVSLVNNAHLYEVAALRFDDERFRDLLSRCYSSAPRRYWTAFLHGAGIKPDGGSLRLESSVYEETGVAYLRSASRTVVLKFGPHGGGHGHPDKLSISVHDGMAEIIPDLGTPGYGVPDHIRWYRKTLAHSTVVVDGKDQKETEGSLVRFKATREGGEVIGECTGAYEGVTLRRSLSLTGKVLTDTFVCDSTAPHTYDYVLILAEPVTVPTDATPAELPEGGGYERIQNPRQWKAGNEAVLSFRGGILNISSPGPFTLITGKAPGIPGSTRQNSTMQPCYPLLVRSEGDSMKIVLTLRMKN